MVRHQRSARRRLVALLCSVVLMACAACGSGTATRGSDGPECAPADGKVTLTYWTWIPGAPEVAAVWNKAHPDIQVQVIEITGGQDGGYQNMLNAVAAGAPPDLVQVELDQLPQFRTLQALKDIGNCPGVAEAKEKFPDWVWSQVSDNGHDVWAVPQDIGPVVMLYRKDILQRHGIAVPRTWDEYAAAAAALHAADPTVHLANFKNPTTWFAALCWQAGARWFSDEGQRWRVSLDDPASVKVADYWDRLLRSGNASFLREGLREDRAINDGKIATTFVAAWGLELVRLASPETAGKWGVAPLPQWDLAHPRSANWGGSTSAVLAGAKHPAAASTFALWLSTDPLAQKLSAEKGGLFPATTAGQQNLPENPKITQFFGVPINPALRAASDQVTPDFTWGPLMNLTYPRLKDELNAAVTNGTPLRDALTRANALTVRDLVRQSQPVAGQ